MVTDFLNGLLDSGWLNNLIQIIFGVIITLTKIIILPFGKIIQTFIPDLDSALTQIASYYDYVSQGIGWALSAFAIPNSVVAIMIAYAVFSFYLPFQLWALKLALAWKKTLWG